MDQVSVFVVADMCTSAADGSVTAHRRVLAASRPTDSGCICCTSCTQGLCQRTLVISHVTAVLRAQQTLPLTVAACACVCACAGEGFISGFTKPPPECTSISVRTCTRCIRSQDPFNCLKCANNPMWKVSMLAGALDPSMGKADGCSSCYDSTVPDKCVECLTSNAPCAQCALEQPDAAVQMNVASCINCTQRHGQTFKSACISCSQLGAQPESVSQCNSCLEAMKPLACDKTDYNPGCWNPEVHSGACNTCASRAQSFGTCLACMKSSPYSGDCESCALLDPAKQDDCYHCAKSAAHAGSGCSDCFRDLSDPSQLQQCVGCLSNPKIGAEGKDWCYGCQNWCSTLDTRAQCIACLGTPQDTYWSACSCNNYLSAQ